ncbi:MAG: hydroxylamine reductase [Elusimicrobia bacterium]|nr:hydroxylamine reductase [Elusimicrobiota bacterium]
MQCRQCEQATGATACTTYGACGKAPETSMLQDVLIETLKGIAVIAHAARGAGIRDQEVDHFVTAGLFTTITNVNFDDERLMGIINGSKVVRKKIQGLYGKQISSAAVAFEPAGTKEGLAKQWAAFNDARKKVNEDIQSLREIVLYGIKGVAAYADHAAVMGKTNEEVTAFFHTALAAIADDSQTADALTGLVLECGKVNLSCMEMLDAAHCETFGIPQPTAVALGVKKGPAIIVSGHDLPDLKILLEQTAGTGVNIYTHGEMLPAHGYPGLKKYPHLAGHFGTAWQNQQKEFDKIPAVVLMTTNCIQKPMNSYNDRIFTTGLVAWPKITHIARKNDTKDFSPLIAKAKALGGFAADNIEKSITVGFGHNAVLGVADKIITAVKTGKIRHFFLVGGCDGAKPGRNYYTEFAQKAPADTLILTLACGKFRFNRMEFGTVEGLPRLLDLGQCNDAYSAVKIAVALADAFKVGVNDLPLSMILSWYEQKAVCILLTLLYLGIKNVRVGPTLPAFISPAVLKLLVEKFQLKPITTPDQDLKDILGK